VERGAWGRARSISRVPAAEPRISTPPTVPSGQRMTVQPVHPFVSVPCPTRNPEMAVSIVRPPDGVTDLRAPPPGDRPLPRRHRDGYIILKPSPARNSTARDADLIVFSDRV